MNNSENKLQEDLAQVADLLAYAAPSVQPRAELKERLLAQVDAAVSHNEKVIAAKDRSWREIFPGIAITTLARDKTFRSEILRIDAGATLPSHPHPGAEQAIVLEGSCYSGETLLSKGDFLLSPAGSTHPPVRAVEDCLLLVVTER